MVKEKTMKKIAIGGDQIPEGRKLDDGKGGGRNTVVVNLKKGNQV